MAYFKRQKNRLGVTYYYSQVKNDKEWTRPKTISLQTSDLKLACERHEEVEDIEYKIKAGISYSLSWENSEGKTKLIKQTLGTLQAEWLRIKKINVRPDTYKRYRDAMNRLADILGKSCPPRAITTKSIESFKRFYNNTHNPAGININLRGVKCFLLWCVDEGHIAKMPKIVMMYEPPAKPRYIKESEWDDIMALPDTILSQWWKDVFNLYLELGCRRKEIIHGYIDGSFLIVPPEFTKAKRELEIPVTYQQIQVIQTIHIARDEFLTNCKNIRDFKNRFTKAMNKASKEVGIYIPYETTFHSIRHTFAVKTYLESNDIYEVSRRMNHGNVSTTEKYSQFSIHRLAQDFPSIAQKHTKIGDLETRKVETRSYQDTISLRYN